jgi:hypothetical protein
MSKGRDNQRTAVYRWEHKVIKKWPKCNKSLTWQECRELVNRVWSDYRPGEDPPKVVCNTRARHWAKGSRWKITLPPKDWAKHTIVVLHETAHSLVPTDEEAHGPKFASLMLELWAKYGGVPENDAKSMAVRQKPRRVRFAMAADRAKMPTKAWVEWNDLKMKLWKMLRECQENEPDKYD